MWINSLSQLRNVALDDDTGRACESSMQYHVPAAASDAPSAAPSAARAGPPSPAVLTNAV